MPARRGAGGGKGGGRTPSAKPRTKPPQHQQRQPGIESVMTPPPRAVDPRHRGSGRLAGKVALITGGDSGIGRAVAIAFAREGADVAVAYLDEHGDAAETCALVEREGRRCLLLAGDVGDEVFCQQAVRRTVAELGRLDVLVNNAAGRGIRVNAVAPGPVWTPLIPASFPAEQVAEFGSDVPFGRPAEIAPSYVFLASDDASYMSGQVLHPNGGEIVNG
jgi:NAD(P)-dependent dehydrogenase (short-subunit alcohol dehydrogenase family)